MSAVRIDGRELALKVRAEVADDVRAWTEKMLQLKQPLSVVALTTTPTPPPVGLVITPWSGPTPSPSFPPFPGG